MLNSPHLALCRTPSAFYFWLLSKTMSDLSKNLLSKSDLPYQPVDFFFLAIRGEVQ